MPFYLFKTCLGMYKGLSTPNPQISRNTLECRKAPSSGILFSSSSFPVSGQLLAVAAPSVSYAMDCFWQHSWDRLLWVNSKKDKGLEHSSPGNFIIQQMTILWEVFFLGFQSYFVPSMWFCLGYFSLFYPPFPLSGCFNSLDITNLHLILLYLLSIKSCLSKYQWMVPCMCVLGLLW